VTRPATGIEQPESLDAIIISVCALPPIDEAAGTNNHPAAIAVFFVRRQACASLSFSGCDYSGSDEIFLRSEKRNERDAQCNLVSGELAW
jgi:hypothetical protein